MKKSLHDEPVAGQFLSIVLPRNFSIIPGQTNFKSSWAKQILKICLPRNFVEKTKSSWA
jgi:hypothetical protein